MFMDRCYISFKKTREEAMELYKKCKKDPCVACVMIAGKRAKTWRLYEDLRIKHITRHEITIDPNEYPWVVAWENCMARF